MIAPRTLRAVSTIADRDAAERDQRRAGGEVGEADPVAGSLTTMPPSRSPIERDEEADADADRELERHRDRVHDRLAQPGEHEHEREQALDHDDRHADLPRQARGRG